MTLFPQHRVSRIAALCWLLACVGFLIVTLGQPALYANDRAALTHLVPVYFLGFPSTHLAFVIVAKIKLALYLNGEFEPGIFSEGVYLWTLMALLGYAQWFIALPWISRASWRLCGELLNHDRKHRP